MLYISQDNPDDALNQIDFDMYMSEQAHVSGLLSQNINGLCLPSDRPWTASQREYAAKNETRAQKLFKLSRLLEKGDISGQELMMYAEKTESGMTGISLDGMAEHVDAFHAAKDLMNETDLTAKQEQDFIVSEEDFSANAVPQIPAPSYDDTEKAINAVNEISKKFMGAHQEIIGRTVMRQMMAFLSKGPKF